MVTVRLAPSVLGEVGKTSPLGLALVAGTYRHVGFASLATVHEYSKGTTALISITYKGTTAIVQLEALDGVESGVIVIYSMTGGKALAIPDKCTTATVAAVSRPQDTLTLKADVRPMNPLHSVKIDAGQLKDELITQFLHVFNAGEACFPSISGYKLVVTLPQGGIVGHGSSFDFSGSGGVTITGQARSLLNIDSWESLVSHGVGGLDDQFAELNKSVFGPLALPPDVRRKLDIQPARGVVFYGPPGTGKTLIARTLGSIMNAEVTVVNGPEVFDKYVGGTEENIRKLFEPARQDLEENGDDADLHLIILDEFDSVCSARGGGDSTGTRNAAVNQILTMIDGVNALPNILVIGLTNRLDMIDKAVLRAGRMELQLEIGLPDEAGRLQILQIHTKTKREAGAIEGTDEEFDALLRELAAKTKNFSGSELHRLVHRAAQAAIHESRMRHGGKVDPNIVLTFDNFRNELQFVRPIMGSDRTFETLPTAPEGKLRDGQELAIREIVDLATRDSAGVGQPQVVLLSGARGVGKTSSMVEAITRLGNAVPFVRVVRTGVMNDVVSAVSDAHSSERAIVYIPSLEPLLGYSAAGRFFDTSRLITLQNLVENADALSRCKRLLIVAETLIDGNTCEDLGLYTPESHRVFVMS